MPKERYKIMRRYMPTVGEHGVDMMIRTCTVQVNLDYSSEADMVKKFRVSLALQPLATALFANSPFTEGKPNGFLSFRSQVWTDTDPNRSGMLPFVFESGMGFERWIDYMLDVPMYFVRRDHQYIDAAGQSFRDFLAGQLPALPGELPTMGDWEDHLTTVFPEVRLKKFLEMRGADGGPWGRLCALPAFWVGLLYDPSALDAAWDLVAGWDAEQRQQLRQDVPRMGLKAEIAGRSLQSIAKEVMEITTAGLQNRDRCSASGDNETGFLTPLWDIALSGETPAERKLKLYQTDWGQRIEPIFKQFAY
jgi:glutamate--cysteine ligase